MAATNVNTNEQVFNAYEDESLDALLTHVICVIMQRGLWVAGFSSTKELLTIHYTGYNRNKPVWELDFFEHLIVQEPLFTVREKVKAVFICDDKNMVIPNDLYDEDEAGNWIRRIHFIEPKDVVLSYPLEAENAQYLLAVPMGITELININFKKAIVAPLPIYHFAKTNSQGLYLQCCITNEQVCATLHNYSQLLWHKVFDYTCAEDIGYAIKLLCIENNISPSDISLNCNAISAAEYNVINDLSQYFPGVRDGKGNAVTNRWEAATCLAQQLIECA
jgi:hypothetical protein